MKGMNKKGIEMEMIGWYVMAIAVLIILVVGAIVLKGKGTGAIAFVKNLFRFGR